MEGEINYYYNYNTLYTLCRNPDHHNYNTQVTGAYCTVMANWPTNLPSNSTEKKLLEELMVTQIDEKAWYCTISKGR
jgi:hypothetical protein